MTTVLDKALKRQVTVEGVDYTLTVDPDGMRLTGKGKRRPEVDLRWRDLVSGDAAMTAALNASLAARPSTAPASAEPPATERSAEPVAKPATKRAAKTRAVPRTP